MGKLILMSVIFAMIAIPVHASREPDARKGLRKAIKNLLIYEVIYLLLLRYLWGYFQ